MHIWRNIGAKADILALTLGIQLGRVTGLDKVNRDMGVITLLVLTLAIPLLLLLGT